METIRQLSPETEKTIPQSSAELLNHAQMYEISGQEKITEHSLKRYLKDKKQDEAIKKLAENPSPIILTKKRSHKENPTTPKEYAEMILSAPIDTHAHLIEAGLNNADVAVQQICANMIFNLPYGDERTTVQKKIAKLVKTGLNNKNIGVQKAYADMIHCVPEEDKNNLKEKVTELIEAGLNNEDTTAQKAYAEIIPMASQDKKTDLLLAGLSKDDFMVQGAYAEMITWASKSDDEDKLIKQVIKLIKAGPDAKNPDSQNAYAQMFWSLPHPEQRKLFQSIKEKMGNSMVEPPLYIRNKKISKDEFKRDDFSKTGSKTTLIGGSLKDKTIIRQLTPKAFLAWQKTFENYQLWKQEGFDYVPVEPIQSYRLNKQGLIDIYSGVLDLNLESWKRLTYDFKNELEADKEKIEDVLIKQKIDHGHTHGENFCLRFFRDENGKVDFSKKPRIYLIDFDQAKSS